MAKFFSPEKAPGKVAEWLKAHAWKACVGNTTAGSNPALSDVVLGGGLGVLYQPQIPLRRAEFLSEGFVGSTGLF